MCACRFLFRRKTLWVACNWVEFSRSVGTFCVIEKYYCCHFAIDQDISSFMITGYIIY